MDQKHIVSLREQQPTTKVPDIKEIQSNFAKSILLNQRIMDHVKDISEMNEGTIVQRLTFPDRVGGETVSPLSHKLIELSSLYRAYQEKLTKFTTSENAQKIEEMLLKMQDMASSMSHVGSKLEGVTVTSSPSDVTVRVGVPTRPVATTMPVPTMSAPTVVPVATMPVATMPVATMPVATMPVATMPVATMPVATMPVPKMPVEQHQPTKDIIPQSNIEKTILLMNQKIMDMVKDISEMKPNVFISVSEVYAQKVLTLSQELTEMSKLYRAYQAELGVSPLGFAQKMEDMVLKMQDMASSMSHAVSKVEGSSASSSASSASSSSSSSSSSSMSHAVSKVEGSSASSSASSASSSSSSSSSCVTVISSPCVTVGGVPTVPVHTIVPVSTIPVPTMPVPKMPVPPTMPVPTIVEMGVMKQQTLGPVPTNQSSHHNPAAMMQSQDKEPRESYHQKMDAFRETEYSRIGPSGHTAGRLGTGGYVTTMENRFSTGFSDMHVKAQDDSTNLGLPKMIPFHNISISPQSIFDYGMEFIKVQNYSMGIAYIRRASDRGLAAAQNYLGFCYSNGLGGSEIDLVRAFQLYESASKNGDVMATKNLAECYTEGYGVEQNETKAHEILSLLVSDNNDADALLSLAYDYMNGCAVEEDAGHAKKLLKSVRGGCPHVSAELAAIYMQEGNQAKADEHNKCAFDILTERVQKWNENENAWEQYILAQMYQHGVACKQNRVRAFELYSLAAKKGQSNAQFQLGLCYSFGSGTKKDNKLAQEWFDKVEDPKRQKTYLSVLRGSEEDFFAANSTQDALRALSTAYAYGVGVVRNSQKSSELLNKTFRFANASLLERNNLSK
jgi:TPR repeat protein